MGNEKWTSEIVNSVNGIQKADPSPYLYSKIMSRINSNGVEKISLKWAFLSFSTLILLFILNFTFTKHSELNETKEIIFEQQMMNSDQLY